MTPIPFATCAAAVARRRDVHIETASALAAGRRHAEAIEECKRAMLLDPDDARPWVNMGVARLGMRDFDAAADSYHRAIELDPACAVAHDGLGVVHRMTGDVAGAIAWHRRAVELRPDYPAFRRNLAGALEASGEVEAALEGFDHLLAADPSDREARVGRGLGRLYTGDMRGMFDLDARLDQPARLLAAEVPGIPRWDGSDLGDKTLLVNQYYDGLGDAIMGIRSAPAAQARCGRLIVACAAPIARLLARADGVDAVITGPDELAPLLPDVAAQCPPLGLPWYCGLGSIDGIPAESRVPYLAADPERVRYWRGVFGITGLFSNVRFNIGIAWQGSPDHSNDANRSVRLKQFAPLAEIPGVCLWSLQKGKGIEQLPGSPFQVVDLNSNPTYRDGDLLETAAVMQALDLIISIDTGLAHLAGALGRPVWIALPHVAEWRWLRDRDDSPWYPTARLFRQSEPGDWHGVFRRMAEALAEFA